MKRVLSIALALCMLLSCAVFFTGCSVTGSSEYPVTVRDTVIEKEPQNIVVLNDVLADVVSYIGYDIKMVGRSTECDQDFLYVVPTVGTAAAPDIPAITSAGTDLVIADSTLGADVKSNLEAEGITVLLLDVPNNEEELKQLYIDLGTALGGSTTGSAKGEDGYNDLLDMLGTMNTAISNVVQTVAYLYMNENGELCTFVKGDLDYKFFNYNGNSNVFLNQAEPQVNVSELRIGSPNYIFYDSEDVLTYLAADEELNHLNALESNRTMQIPKAAFRRYGTSAEDAVFQILNFIEKDSKATPDEATADITATAAAAAEETAAPEVTEAATEAPVEEAEGDENVITFSVQDE